MKIGRRVFHFEASLSEVTAQKSSLKRMFRHVCRRASSGFPVGVSRRPFSSKVVSVTGKRVATTIGGAFLVGSVIGISITAFTGHNVAVAAEKEDKPKLESADGTTKLAAVEATVEKKETTIHILISTLTNPLELFMFHSIQFKLDGEAVWHIVRPSFLTQLICWVVSTLTGSLAYPWLVTLAYNDVINNHPQLKQAVDVDLNGLDLVMPFLISFGWGILTLGGDAAFGFANQRFAKAIEDHLKFKAAKNIQFH
jgi:hypothetical protein